MADPNQDRSPSADVQAYIDFHGGKLLDHYYDPSELAMALAGLPSVLGR